MNGFKAVQDLLDSCLFKNNMRGFFWKVASDHQLKENPTTPKQSKCLLTKLGHDQQYKTNK